MSINRPHTGMAVTIDIGNPNNIHPTDKQDVGYRLAALALHQTYGLPGIASGAVYHSVSIVGGTAKLTFANTGADRHFYPADATIQGDQVILSTDKVPQPIAVRYAWEDDASNANLFNKEGYPTAPFRTDDWPAITPAIKYHISLVNPPQ